jgi:hypothetical protein
MLLLVGASRTCSAVRVHMQLTAIGQHEAPVVHFESVVCGICFVHELGLAQMTGA